MAEILDQIAQALTKVHDALMAFFRFDQKTHTFGESVSPLNLVKPWGRANPMDAIFPAGVNSQAGWSWKAIFMAGQQVGKWGTPVVARKTLEQRGDAKELWMAVDLAKTRRRHIAPLLAEGERTVSFVRVSLASGRGPGYGSNWLEGAPEPQVKPPPTRAEKALHAADVVTSIAAGSGWTSLKAGRAIPSVKSPFDLTAAGAKGSYAYRLVGAAAGLRGLRTGQYFLVTDRRLALVLSGATGDPYRILFEAPLSAVAAVSRRSDCLVIEFADASLVRLYAQGGLTAGGEAKRLESALAPAGGREAQLGGYVPPWAGGVS